MISIIDKRNVMVQPLRPEGVSYQTASNVLGLMVLMSIPGRFVFGSLGDRFNKKVLLFLLLFIPKPVKRRTDHPRS